MAMVFTPMGPMDENDPRIQQFGWVKDAGGSYVTAPQGGPTAGGPVASGGESSGPLTFQQLQQASMDRNMPFINQRIANDNLIKSGTGGLDLSQGIWGGMDDYSLTGAVGGLANSALGRQLRDALVRKYGSTDALNNMINKYWAGFIDNPNNHNFNQDFWQKLGTLEATGHDINPYLQAGVKQEYKDYKGWGISDAERQAWANDPQSLKAQGVYGVQGGLAKQNGGQQGPLSSPVNTPQNPPAQGPLASPINTGFQPTGPGYTYQNQNRNIGQNPLQPPAMTNNQPFNSYTSNFQLNPNQFKLPGQR